MNKYCTKYKGLEILKIKLKKIQSRKEHLHTGTGTYIEVVGYKVSGFDLVKIKLHLTGKTS